MKEKKTLKKLLRKTSILYLLDKELKNLVKTTKKTQRRERSMTHVKFIGTIKMFGKIW